MTLTDEIYRELMDGLRTGVDYDKLRLKWEGSKGPFYNALQRVFADVAGELAQASSDLNAALQKSGEVQQRVTALEAQERKTETAVKAKAGEKESLEQQTGTARKQLQGVNGELAARKGLLDQAGELEDMGFDLKQLRLLRGTLVAIGTKRGLKAKEAIAAFFSDLEDYDAKVGFEREVQRLNTIAETSKLEVKKWQAEKDTLQRAYEEKRDAMNAMESLLKQGLKTERILAWDKMVEAAGGVEQLSRDIGKYKSAKEALAAWGKEVQRLTLKRDEIAGEVSQLEKRKAEIQGAIAALSKAGMDEIKATREEALSGVTAVITDLTEKALAVGEKLGRCQAILDSNECIRSLSSLITGKGKVIAAEARAAALALLKPLHEWMKTNQSQLSLPPHLVENLGWCIKDLEQWQP